LTAEGPAGLYIHYPFCRAKCPYCHFASVPTRELEPVWREGIRTEAASASGKDLAFDTIYIGGGTPSLLTGLDAASLRAVLAAEFRLDLLEFTMEANPEAAGRADLDGWRAAGVTRLSIGVQSFDPGTLRTLSRGYDPGRAEAFVRDARLAGFDNISLDIMIGVPGETAGTADLTLDKAIALDPTHVSVYILEAVEGLPFEKTVESSPPDEDAIVDNYERIRSGLAAAGYRQYEIANFAKPGRECRHNLKYWRYDPFIGLGPSACSHAGLTRWCNVRDIARWARALRGDGELREETIELSAPAAAGEALIFGLRLVEGVDLERIRARYGVDLGARFAGEIEDLCRSGLLAREESRLRIPPDRFLVSNRVFSRFV
jgi:oxygen-independent coproporphyrinogen-3 oxidase